MTPGEIQATDLIKGFQDEITKLTLRAIVAETQVKQLLLSQSVQDEARGNPQTPDVAEL